MSPLRASDVPALAKRLGITVSKGNKFHARRRTMDGIKFDSEREAEYIGLLILQQRAGVISHLEIHPSYEIKVNGILIGVYEADARYRDVATGASITIDVKSAPTRTALYKLKKKLVEAIHGIQIQEVE